jgi:membrane protease YdiL (CAAX protease family)
MGHVQSLRNYWSRRFGVRGEFTITIILVVVVTGAIKIVSRIISFLDWLPLRAHIPYFVCGVGISYLYLAYRNLAADHFAVRQPDSESFRAIGGLVVAVFGLLLFGDGVTHYLLDVPLSAFTEHYADSKLPTRVVFKLLLGSVLFVAPAKEVLFRGAVQATLRDVGTERFAVVGTSVLYVGYHAYFLGFDAGSGGTALYLGILGILSVGFGKAKEQTGNLLVPVLVASFLEISLFALSYAKL